MKSKRRKMVSENEVSRFWEHHDVTEVLDLDPKNRLEMVYTPPVKSISLRLPVPLITQIKKISAQMDVAYQSLMKIWLSERAREEALNIK